jgi:hypothetical protein
MDMILMGNERRYSGQRAPAIMSALGFTDWCQAQIKSPDETSGEGSLVLGKYPLPFIEEAAAKIGPLFFGSCPFDCTKCDIRATLPFFEGEGYATFPFVIASARKDAKDERWKITPEGAVVIQRAVVIAASQGQAQTMNPVETLAAIFGLPSFQDDDVDLQRVLDVLVESTEARCAFAVHLSQDTEKQMGILLAGTISDETGTASLAKFGAYEIAHSEETVSNTQAQ